MQAMVTNSHAGRAPGWELLLRRAQTAGLAAAAASKAPLRPIGSAWILVHPGTSAFARWLVHARHGVAMGRTADGGVRIGVPVHLESQAPHMKQAYLQAYAATLDKAGIPAQVHTLTRWPRTGGARRAAGQLGRADSGALIP